MFLSQKYMLGTRTHLTLLARSTCSCKKSVRFTERSTVAHIAYDPGPLQVPGFCASEKWDTLSTNVKELVVSQVADHLMEIFTLRFDCAGALYLSAQDKSGFVAARRSFVPLTVQFAHPNLMRMLNYLAFVGPSQRPLITFRVPHSLSSTSSHTTALLHCLNCLKIAETRQKTLRPYLN